MALEYLLHLAFPNTHRKAVYATILWTAAALALAKELRTTGLSVEVGDGTFRLKKSFEVADKLARRIVILGEDEVSTGILTVKTFATSEQIKIPRAELAAALKSVVRAKNGVFGDAN